MAAPWVVERSAQHWQIVGTQQMVTLWCSNVALISWELLAEGNPCVENRGESFLPWFPLVTRAKKHALSSLRASIFTTGPFMTCAALVWALERLCVASPDKGLVQSREETWCLLSGSFLYNVGATACSPAPRCPEKYNWPLNYMSLNLAGSPIWGFF